MKTRIGIVLGIIILAGVGWYFLRGGDRDEFLPYEDFNDFLAITRSEKEIAEYTENLKEAYRNDTYGGDTPEETLNLFIDALKAGDTALAAKYFIVEKQARMAEELRAGIDSGGVDLFLTSLEGNRTESGYAEDHFFSYEIKGNLAMTIELVKNPYSPVWKIESL
ncbi:MAG: hypothetical protein COW88_00270 [Candidatus Lloydbacteria bacterium CG22_combo_CG10-13_8_21_14_all_47_15]|uniref:Uncharacterized protein n=1 Tax=Candidatus Lloydbacteria bacterium CG22_combo_CG10-13_8_21_14_all_47_15 TaxID=1974635 RepID=A0A2H0CVS8_9BACT|nr:MAG: hypothetical protein COW88_00270 [Candidatus Lloydbacteria bacterium CG22_combo_CG10-13_8_21_14_all_47_15]